MEGPGMSAKLRGAESEPREAPNSGAQRTRWNTLEVNLRVWVMVQFREPKKKSPSLEHFDYLPEPLFKP